MSTADPLQSLSRFERDEFDTRPSYPFLQWDNSPDLGGLAIATENIERAHFDTKLALASHWEPYRRSPVRGGEVTGLITASPVLAVLRRGQIRRFDRETGEYLGIFDRALYDRTTQITRTRYLVALLA